MLISVETDASVTAEVLTNPHSESPSSPASTSEALLGARDAEVEPTFRAGDDALIRVKAAPSVRRLAAERGVNLATIRATGPGGRVTRDDVLEATSGSAAGLATTRARRSSPPAHFRQDDPSAPLKALRTMSTFHCAV